MNDVKKLTFSSPEEAILTTLACYNALTIYPTAFELFSFLLKPKLSTHCAERDISYADILNILAQLENQGLIGQEHGFYFFSFLSSHKKNLGTHRIATDSLLDQKWRILARYLSVFQILPFVQGSFVSGSLAIGTVRAHSDFDFLIISKPNRLYTLRLFSVCVFGLLGIRRTPHHREHEICNKVCLNHYLSASSLIMKDRLTEGMFLYTRLIPVYTEQGAIIDHFFKANEWIQDYFFRTAFEERVRYSERPRVFPRWNPIKFIFEFILSGILGDSLEYFVYRSQKKRIPEEQNLFATPNELNLHPNLERRHVRLQKILKEYFRRLW